MTVGAPDHQLSIGFIGQDDFAQRLPGYLSAYDA